jgi:hypothetical protein
MRKTLVRKSDQLSVMAPLAAPSAITSNENNKTTLPWRRFRPSQPGSTPMLAPTKYTLRETPAVGNEIWNFPVKLTRRGPNIEAIAPTSTKVPVRLAKEKDRKDTSVDGRSTKGGGELKTLPDI